ncbi:hypothetical protein [Streptomyces sp. NPDC056244]|uniref:hypothetical protein n=1 Tax=unclassified Streptomyces TaxID=2593676 RepID=UPI0035DCBE60
MLSDYIVLAWCVTATAVMACCAFVCITIGKIAGSALRNSRSADRPQIIGALATMFRHFLRPWWRSK